MVTDGSSLLNVKAFRRVRRGTSGEGEHTGRIIYRRAETCNAGRAEDRPPSKALHARRPSDMMLRRIMRERGPYLASAAKQMPQRSE